MKYVNPVRRGMYPDPSVVRVGEYYYMVNSTFEYYPGISVSKSRDLVNWKNLPGVAAETSQADLRNSKPNEGIFAVCIRHHDGQFYVVTTNFAEFKTFIIRGRLEGDGIVWENDRIEVDVNGIDPDVYFEDGRMYLQFTGYVNDNGLKALQQVEINPETGDILRGPEVICCGTGGRDVEGPHIVRNKGWYYLLAAEGGTGQGHMITIFRSRNLWGPYEDEPGVNPLFTNRDRAEEPLQNIGHADLFKDGNGCWWMTCLGTRPAQVGFSQITNIGRETLLYPVRWDGDWPEIYNGVPTEEVDLTGFPEHEKSVGKQQFAGFCDDFSNGSISNEWLTLRNGLGESLKVEEGCLRLWGNNVRLSDLGTPAFAGVRQAEHQETFRVELSDETDTGDGYLGLAVIIDATHYVEIAFCKAEEGGYDVFRKQMVADVEIDRNEGHLDVLPDELRIFNENDRKIFTASSGTQSVSFTASAINLSNESLAALNTGDIEGIHAYGNGMLSVKKVTRK